MKRKLINTWFELYDMRCVGSENSEKKKELIAKVENALWNRYGYDIALKYQS